MLLIAEMCNPSWTSVPLVGYNMAAGLARHPGLDVTVATQVRNRAALEGDPLHDLARVEYIDTEFVAAPFHRVSKLLRRGQSLGWSIDTALMWPSYVAFEKLLHRRYAKELARGGFDIIHRLTPLSPTLSGPLAAAVPVPMVIGPINGGLPWPKAFDELRRREREWLIPLRGAFRLLPYYRSMFRNLAGYISGSGHVADNVPSWYKGRTFHLAENGIDPVTFPLAKSWHEPRGRFRFITVGRLVPVKGIDMALEALAGLDDCELVIVGDGPERDGLEQSARDFGVADRVRFTGWLAQAQIAAEMRSAQAFVFPSVKDFGGGVVLEAMASGLPCIVLDYGGPAELVSTHSGIRIPMQSRDKLVPLIRRSMNRLAGNHGLCRDLSRGAVDRVRSEFTWDAKADTIHGFYNSMLERGTRPMIAPRPTIPFRPPVVLPTRRAAST